MADSGLPWGRLGTFPEAPGVSLGSPGKCSGALGRALGSPWYSLGDPRAALGRPLGGPGGRSEGLRQDQGQFEYDKKTFAFPYVFSYGGGCAGPCDATWAPKRVLGRIERRRGEAIGDSGSPRCVPWRSWAVLGGSQQVLRGPREWPRQSSGAIVGPKAPSKVALNRPRS